MERHDAIIQANRDRLRPILMTTIALVAGMTAAGAVQWAGRRHQSIDRRAGGRRPIALSAADPFGGAGLYSLFDDLARSHIWSRMGGFAGARLWTRAPARGHSGRIVAGTFEQ